MTWAGEEGGETGRRGIVMALAWAVSEDTDRDESDPVLSSLDPPGSLHAVDETAAQSEAPAAGSLLVLVADDEPSLRSTLSTMLETAGYEVVQAENGQVALGLLNEREFDVLVLDLYMPKLDGLEILRQLQGPPPMVIVYSAFAYFSLAAVREEVGSRVFRFVRKPVPPLEFMAAVNEAVAELDR